MCHPKSAANLRTLRAVPLLYCIALERLIIFGAACLWGGTCLESAASWCSSSGRPRPAANRQTGQTPCRASGKSLLPHFSQTLITLITAAYLRPGVHTLSRTSHNRLRRPNHQARNRYASLHTQFSMGDLRLQSHAGKHSFDVDAGVTVTAVQLQAVVNIRVDA